MASRNHSRAASWTRAHLAQAGVGIGIAAATFGGGASAMAAVPAPAPHMAGASHSAHTAVKPYSTVTVSPSTVRAGQHLTISGNAPRNARAGRWITLQSDAFASKYTVNGIPAIRTQVLVNGTYSATATIRAGLRPTNYAVMATFQGKALDTVAWITVRRPIAHPYSSVMVSPRTVRGGERVTITGSAPRNARAGSWITLQSDAFASKLTVNGIPAVRTQVLVNGKYAVTATIRKGLKPTDYAVMGSYRGRALDTVAWMTVR